MIEAQSVAAGPFAGLSLREPLRPGVTCALVGPNGAGKSTFLRLLNGSQAVAQGDLRVDGIEADGSSQARCLLRRQVALVRQDPRDQLVSGRVADEVAFGPRNLGLDPRAVAARVEAALAAAGLTGFSARETAGLSGGELQRLALAGALAVEPTWLAADEPCAMLDEKNRARVRGTLRSVTGSGAGLVQATHYVREAAAADRVILFGHGAPRCLTPEELFRDQELLGLCGLDQSFAGKAAAFLARRGLPLELVQDPPRCVEVLRSAGFVLTGVLPEVEPPLGRPGMQGDSSRRGAGGPAAGGTAPASATLGGLELRDVSVHAQDAWPVRGLDLAIPRGQVTLVSGPSGSGKTTAARVLTGLLKPSTGQALLDGHPVQAGQAGLALQEPEAQLFCATVCDDVAFGPRLLGMPEAEALARARQTLGRLGLDRRLWELSPFSLSGGEARKAALAGVVACDPGAYVLDEPTAGLDGPSRQEVRGLVRSLAEQGAAVAVMTHDLEEWLPEVSAVVLLNRGRVAWQGCPRDAVAPGLLERCGMTPSLGLLLLREAWR